MGGDVTIPDPVLWAVLAGLIAASGFFSAAEAALFALGQVRLAQMEEKGAAAAAVIKELLATPGHLIVTLTLLSDTVNIVAVVLIAWTIQTRHPDAAAGTWHAYLHSSPLASSLVISLLVLLVFAQTLPKALGVRGSGLLASGLAYPLSLALKVMYPFRVVVCAAAEVILKAFGTQPHEAAVDGLAGDDIRELVEAGSRQGLLDVTERELLVNLLRSGDITARDVMTSRSEIVAAAVASSEAEVRALMKEKNFTRLPLYEGRKDHYVGVITAKDLLRLRRAQEEGKSLKDVMRPALMVPESRRITDLLLDFKRGRVHLALVVDEFGEVSGLVTMEDVLEEIFGELNEDEDEPELVNLGDNHWKALGSMELRDFNTVTGSRLPSAGAATLAGLVLAKLGRRPRPGDEVRVAGLVFVVVEVHGIIIHRLEVKREEGP